jgi:drug/metabolite transporter (DMT)-like permease
MSTLFLYLINISIWGMSWFCISYQVRIGSPALAVGLRFCLASLILFAWTHMTKSSVRLRPDQYVMLIAQGLSNFGVNYWMLYLACEKMPSGLVALSLTVLVGYNMVGEIVFLGRQVSRSAALGVASGFVGLALVYWQSYTHASDKSGVFVGMLLAVSGAVCASVGNLLTAKIKQDKSSQITALAISMGAGGLGMLGVAVLTGDRLYLPVTISFVGTLLYLSIFGSAIAFASYLKLIESVGPTRAAFTTLVIPLMALVVSIGLENLRLTIIALLGVGIILLANLVVRVRTPNQ